MDSLISGKFYLLEQDARFPLEIPSGNWQPLTGNHFSNQTGESIYMLSGYGVLYVGSDSRGRRPYEHRNELRRNDHNNQYMQNVVNKNGLSGFYYQPIVTIPPDCVDFRPQIENSYIKHFDTYKNGYNLCEFAGTPLLGRKMTEEAKEKLSKAKQGAGNAFFGKTHSEETKRKQALASKQNSAKPFKLKAPDGTIFEGRDVKEFAKARGLVPSGLTAVLRGIRNHHKGWRKG